MRISHKVVLCAVASFGLALAVVCVLWIRQEMSLIEGSARHDLAVMGRSLRPALMHTWRSEGRDRAFELLEFATERIRHRARDVEIRWVGLDSASDVLEPTEIEQVRSGMEVHHRLDDDEEIYVYVPFKAADLPAGVLELSRSLTQEHAEVRSAVREILATIAALLCGLTAITLIAVDRLVGRPLQQLAAQARSVASGDLGRRVRLGRLDELGVVAAEMNTMCERLSDAREQINADHAERIAMLQQLRHADRLSTVGTLAAGVAHELGTPLNVVLGRAKMIATGEECGDAARASARAIGEQGTRIVRIIRQLLDFARRPVGSRALTSMVPIVERSLQMLTPIADKLGVSVSLAPNPVRDKVSVEATELEQVITNLVTNALHASAPNGEICIWVERAAARPPDEVAAETGEYLRVAILDNGTGIRAADISRLFDPFFTTKAVGEGTGLGLSVAYGIVRDHGGWIEVDSEVGRGSVFVVNLPIATTT